MAGSRSFIGKLRRIAIIALPCLTGVSGALGWLLPEPGVLDWLFKISLSGTVGLWTNHFAVRMLFRPHRRTVFGRQGLIPAKRAELARAVGEAVAQRLLDTDSVLAYLEDRNILEKGAHLAVDWFHNLFTRRTVRTRVAGYLQGVLEDLVERHSEAAVRRVQDFITELMGEKASAGAIWPSVREMIRDELASPDTREAAARAVISLADRYDTEIAAFVNDALKEYIDSKRFLEKLMLGMGKRILRVDEVLIRREIRRRVLSPDFFDDLLLFLDENTPEIQEWLDSPGVMAWFQGKLEGLRERVDRWIRTEGVELGAEKVRTLLFSDRLWEWVSEQLDVQIEKLADLAREKIRSPGFRSAARGFARKAASGFDIQGMVQGRVNRLDLDELEGLVLKVSGENLAAIELFGALLGGMAGVVLIDIRFLPVLPLLVLVFLGLEKGLSSPPFRRSPREHPGRGRSAS